MEHDLAAVVRRYDEVWAERDAARRREILAAIWTDDTIYRDPDVPDGLVGPDARTVRRLTRLSSRRPMPARRDCPSAS
jgi:hypothetical protein